MTIPMMFARKRIASAQARHLLKSVWDRCGPRQANEMRRSFRMTRATLVVDAQRSIKAILGLSLVVPTKGLRNDCALTHASFDNHVVHSHANRKESLVKVSGVQFLARKKQKRNTGQSERPLAPIMINQRDLHPL
jgi:hypothetical protein